MKSVRPLMAAVTGIALTVALLAGAAPASAADEPVHTYRATPSDTASDRFTLAANGTNVFVTKYANRSNNRMHVARFASADRTPTLAVSAGAPITSYRIYPENLYPEGSATVSGSTLSFELSDRLPYAIVQINGTGPQLAIANDPLEDQATVPDRGAANVVDVTDYVTDLTGATDQTTQIAAAINALYTDDAKDTLFFPDGHYKYAGLELRGRTKPVTIYVDEGALLKNRIQPIMQAMEPAIGIWDSKNITVSGRGVFDGNGFANYDTANGGWLHDAPTSNHQGGAMIVRSENIVFNDTLVRDTKQWNWETHTAKNVVFNNIKGFTPYAQPWIDGLDLASGQNVTVNGAFTLGNDDTFASGHYNPSDGFPSDQYNADRLQWDTEDSFNITVNDHLGWSAGAGNGIRLGHAAYGHALKQYAWNNVHYLGFTHLGITVQNQDQGVSTYPRYEDLRVSNSSFDTSAAGENFAILGRSGSNPADRIGTVVLDNVSFSKEKPSSVQNVTNLQVRGLRVDGKPVTRRSQTDLSFQNVVNRDLDFADDSAPVLQSVPEKNAEVGEAVTFTLSATDADGDPIAYSAGNPGLPSGAALDPVTGAFSWTPSSGDDGTHQIQFVATNPNGASATTTAKIVVTDPSLTRITVPVTVDTSVQAWDAEESRNYGDNEYIRTQNFNDASRGALGQLYSGGQKSQDGKLAFVGFDLAPYADQLAAGELVRAELGVTYMGPTKGALTGTNVLKAARVTGTWVEGNGKTTPTARTNTTAGATTWLNKPTIDASVIASSAPFSVAAAAKVGNDATYSNSQTIVGGRVLIDVTPLTETALASGQNASFALNESNKQDIVFVSREGAARNANATGAAATLTLVIDTSEQPTVPGAPTGVTASLAGPDVRVSWAAPESDGGAAITGYRLYDGQGSEVGRTDAGARSFLVTGLAPNTTRAFTVAAVNDNGESDRSAPSAPVTTPSIALAPSAQLRCVGGKAYLYVTVANRDEAAANITIRTPYGDKSFDTVAPGRSASVALATRASDAPADSVRVEGTQPGGISFRADTSYSALSCR